MSFDLTISGHQRLQDPLDAQNFSIEFCKLFDSEIQEDALCDDILFQVKLEGRMMGRILNWLGGREEICWARPSLVFIRTAVPLGNGTITALI